MSPLFETIRLYDGVLLYAHYHNHRLNSSRKELFGCSDALDILKEVLIPEIYTKGLWKCRVIYAKEIIDIQFLHYTPNLIRSVTCVEGNNLDYSHKYLDRNQIDRLKQNIKTDDILIIKDGLVTDTSIANVAFYDGTQWITPARPLLAGTTRARLIESGAIITANISINDLKKYSKITLFNAMCNFDPIKHINFEISSDFGDKDKKEIDIIVYKDNSIYPIECKKTGFPGKDSIASFSVLNNLKIPIEKG